MSTRSELASARISRRCDVDSTTVHERYVQYVTNPQRPSATANIGLGNQNFFATGHVQCFLRKAWSTMQRTALTLRVGSIRRPDPTARALAPAGLQVEAATAPSAPRPRWRGIA